MLTLEELYSFKGKTAFITGASSGLGERFARVLSSVGARVILAARNLEKLKMLRAELGNAKALHMDISDKLSVSNCFSELEKAGEKIDICINSAGISFFTPIFEEDEHGGFESIIQTNLIGMWYVVKAVANHMRDNAIPGSIINIGSVNGAGRINEGLASYAASKAAVMQLTKALVGELSKHNIRINCINPGLFYTSMTERFLRDHERLKQMEELIPLGFVAKPEDLDGTILLLASNEHSAYITGVCITVDGGVSWGGLATNKPK